MRSNILFPRFAKRKKHRAMSFDVIEMFLPPASAVAIPPSLLARVSKMIE